jgi:hypothetical protein
VENISKHLVAKTAKKCNLINIYFEHAFNTIHTPFFPKIQDKILMDEYIIAIIYSQSTAAPSKSLRMIGEH